MTASLPVGKQADEEVPHEAFECLEAVAALAANLNLLMALLCEVHHSLVGSRT